MKLEDILKLWDQECRLKIDRLDDESLSIPVLHSKFLNILSNERMILKRLSEKKKELEIKLEDYYSGSLDGKDIGREPFQLTLTKTGVQKRIETDPEMLDLNLRMTVQEEKVLVLKEIIGNINTRGFQIKNAIDFIRFTQGADL